MWRRTVGGKERWAVGSGQAGTFVEVATSGRLEQHEVVDEAHALRVAAGGARRLFALLLLLLRLLLHLLLVRRPLLQLLLAPLPRLSKRSRTLHCQLRLDSIGPQRAHLFLRK